MGDETTNCDMAAERAARASKTDLEMENVRLRRRLMEAEQRAERMARRVPTERERKILDMLPRYEDTGDCVMPGDRVALEDGSAEVLCQLHIGESCYSLYTETHDEEHLCGERVKRPAPEVVDADGVPIHEGDRVWHESGCASGVVTSIDAGSLMHTTRYVDEMGTEFRDAAGSLTHARPDSWERLEDDAHLGDCDYFDSASCDGCGGVRAEDCATARILDMVERAKRLAGVE